MKKLNKKKGFTIVELVIVIAVVGVLTAVLVPTFVNLANQAKRAENQTFVRNLNTQMGIREATEGKNKTMYEAMMEAEDIGYNVEKLTPVDGNDVVWDSVANRFAIVDKDGNEVYSDGGIKGTGSQLWKIYAEMPKTQTYSIYAKEGWKVSGVENLKVGFDAGKNTGIATVSYIGTSSVPSIRESIEGRAPKMASSQGQEVVIRTNSASATLTINAKDDTVNHYGVIGKVDAQKIDMNCYNEYGKAAYIKLTEGKVVAKDGGEIAVVFANNTDSSKVAVAKDSNGTIKKGLTTVEAVDTNNFANYAVHLEYSADGTTPYTVTQVEAIGELSVASDTGIQPQGMDYTAVVNLVGYNSLQEAINAAFDGDVVSLLKDYSTSDETLVISKDITLKGNNHSIENKRDKTASTYNDNKSGRDAAIYVNSNATFEDLNLTTTKLCLIHVQSSCTNKTINLNNCVMSAPTNAYGFFVANGADKLNININNTTLRGWCAAYLKCSNSTININDSVLTGVNGATQAPSNGFGTFVIDGNVSSGDTTYGSNNNVKISNTDIYANTDTDAGANIEIWLLIQYRAHNNTVVVTGGNIYSTNPITPEKGWEYHHFNSGSDEDVQSTNTVTVNGVQYYGFPSNHD